MTRFRWVVLSIIFIICTINFADRTNIGIALPFIREEFHISNFEAGAIASLFFLGYACSQIPAGFWFSKHGIRGLVPLAVMGFSAFTFLIGTAQSVAVIKFMRLGLGISEGPIPVGLTSTVNNWFPPREKATGVGVYIGATMFAPIVVPPLCVWLAMTFGWRYMFYTFAIPGFVMALVWWLFVRTHPQESSYVNAAEVAYIKDGGDDPSQKKAEQEYVSYGWLDRLIRVKDAVKITAKSEVFKSRNIWGDCIAYFMMLSVLYGLMTWIPSYLINEKHYSSVTMGYVATAPWIGGMFGSILGGWISDKLLQKRRKPTMLFTAMTTCVMMAVMVNIPENTAMLAIGLFMTGFMLNIGWPAFTAYPMGVTDEKTYPVAIALVNSGGNLGGFFSPMIAGYLLDNFHSYNYVFTYFGLCAVIALIILLTLDEPMKLKITAKNEQVA